MISSELTVLDLRRSKCQRYPNARDRPLPHDRRGAETNTGNNWFNDPWWDFHVTMNPTLLSDR